MKPERPLLFVPRRTLPGLVALALFALSGCGVTSLRLWGPTAPPALDAANVATVKDVPYCKGAKGDDFRHRMDLFLPKGKKDYPVVILVHGGAWLIGDNRCCGLYSTVGEFLASQGIGVVIPNYRLSPGVTHPEHVKDVARVVAWAKSHIAEYGGSPQSIFLAGHSAGGHLVALVATDESYLKAEGLTTRDVKGVISLSGVYRIPPGSIAVTLGGTDPNAMHWDAVSPLRGADCGGRCDIGPGIRLNVDVFGPIFGGDAGERLKASPVAHVRAGLPPFLILSPEKELPTLGPMAREFHQALCQQGCTAHLVTIAKRNHNSIMFTATELGDPAARAIVDFVFAHAPR